MPSTMTIGRTFAGSVDTTARDWASVSMDETAFQATIFALNAAVDAARAGEVRTVFAVGEARETVPVRSGRARGLVTYLGMASLVRPAEPPTALTIVYGAARTRCPLQLEDRKSKNASRTRA